jgi:hypothetical protein
MSAYSSTLVFLEYLAGYTICLLVAVFGLVVIWLMITGKIDLSGLLSEKDTNNKASMSRFQLLIFTFVIALSFFLIVISNIKIVQGTVRSNSSTVPELPDVPSGVLAVLGISASSYAVSKAIQHGAGTGEDDGDQKGN